MKQRLIKIAVVCGLVIAAVYGCVSLVFPKYHVRFRLTVEVKDGDQIKTGSSVIEVDHQIVPDGSVNLGGDNGYRPVFGFAPMVDLGAKGLLFFDLPQRHKDPPTNNRTQKGPLSLCFVE